MKRIGPKMQSVVSFVRKNPGLSMFASARWVAPNGSLKFGYRTVHRAIKAGLVWAVSSPWQTRLYPIAICRIHTDCKESVALAQACKENDNA